MRQLILDLGVELSEEQIQGAIVQMDQYGGAEDEDEVDADGASRHRENRELEITVVEFEQWWCV